MPATQNPHGSLAGSCRRLLGAAALMLGLTVAVLAPAAWAQTTPVSTQTTSDNLLVGSTTTAPRATTTTTAPVVSERQAQASANADTRHVWYIVVALGAVAFVLLVLTIRYWYATRPGQELSPSQLRKRGPADGEAATVEAAPARRRVPDRRIAEDPAPPEPVRRQPPERRSPEDP